MKSQEASKTPDEQWQEFRNEIRRRVEEAQRLKADGQPYNPHYAGINPDELTAEDAELMRKVEAARTVTPEDIFRHDLTFYDVDPSGNFKKRRDDIPESRRLFLQEMANRADSIIRERERGIVERSRPE